MFDAALDWPSFRHLYCRAVYSKSAVTAKADRSNKFCLEGHDPAMAALIGQCVIVGILEESTSTSYAADAD